MSHPDLRPPSDDPLGDDPVADDALRCPLCRYDLRGLPDDRCPECGHAFDRATLRQIADERQQWFFEHARRHRLTAFAQTVWLSLFPRRFWTRVRAGHVIVVGRLWLWAAIASLLTALTFAAAIAGRVLFQPAGDRLPVPLPVAREALRRLVGDGVLRAPAVMFTIAFAWPVVTVATLGLFARSSDRAGVRAAHVWRVALYAWPTALLPIAAAVIVGIRFGTVEMLLDLPPSTLSAVIGLPLSWLLVLALVVAGTTRHLVIAHVRYLRVRHAVAQALLVQTVVWLALVAALLGPRSIF